MLMRVTRIVKEEVDVPELAQILRGALSESGKSVSELCRDAGISRTYWYKLVNNQEDSVAEDALQRIAVALGVDFGIDF